MGLKFLVICFISEDKSRKNSSRKPVPAGDRTRAHCVTDAHGTASSTAVEYYYYLLLLLFLLLLSLLLLLLSLLLVSLSLLFYFHTFSLIKMCYSFSINIKKIRGATVPKSQGRLKWFLPHGSTGDLMVSKALTPQP